MEQQRGFPIGEWSESYRLSKAARARVVFEGPKPTQAEVRVLIAKLQADMDTFDEERPNQSPR